MSIIFKQANLTLTYKYDIMKNEKHEHEQYFPLYFDFTRFFFWRITDGSEYSSLVI